jgi:hypothetical protein
MRFHQARVQETPNVILEERCENSPQKRAKDNPPNATKIMSKCTVKNPPKNRAQTTFEGKKAQ